MSKKTGNSHIGAWLMVDEKNKSVEYQVDSSWFENASDKEQNNIFTKLSKVADAYRNSGYSIFDFVKKFF